MENIETVNVLEFTILDMPDYMTVTNIELLDRFSMEQSMELEKRLMARFISYMILLHISNQVLDLLWKLMFSLIIRSITLCCIYD